MVQGYFVGPRGGWGKGKLGEEVRERMEKREIGKVCVGEHNMTTTQFAVIWNDPANFKVT